jgi:hypothetical protein
MTTASAPMYWSTIFARVAGGASTKEVRRGRRGFDSVLRRGERIDSLLASGCLRKYRIWNISAESATMKYADKMMTEGRRPPHMALLISILANELELPKEGEYISKEPDDDEIQRKCVASAQDQPPAPRGGEYQESETYDFVR